MTLLLIELNLGGYVSAKAFVNPLLEDHEIDWEKKVILDKEIHFEKRKIKEAIYINTFDNGTLMNPDKGIPINQCWTEFFPFITEVKGY